MSRYSGHTNSKVGREAAEVLQQKLFQAATQALDAAMSENKIPGNLLSSCQAILRDSGLSPDMADQDGDEDDASTGVSPSWLSDLEQKLDL